MLNYTLKNKEPVPEPDIIKWGEWFEKADRHVATTKGDNWVISTVFLGIDHNFSGHGDPILFETMVFRTKDWNGEGDGLLEHDCERYSTWEEAEKGHKVMVEKWINDE